MFLLPAIWLAGSLTYCVLVILAVRSLLCARPLPGGRGSVAEPRPPGSGSEPAISILKPLRGLDEGLADNLRSYLTQEYAGAYEVLFGVDTPDDPARAVAEEVCREFPNANARVLVTGTGPYTNPKVYSLEQLYRAARHDLIVMSDSDIRVTSNHLNAIAAEFSDPRLGVETCPYRAVPGDSLWSKLEAIGMNTEFMAGVMVARLVEGMNFSVGPTIVARREVIEQIGGFRRIADYYIDDFLIGRLAHLKGWKVELSRYVIEHRIGSERFWPNLRHRIMWLRGSRRSRPAGYFGQVFTFPIPAALLLWAAAPAWWPAVIAAAALRYAAAFAVAGGVLRDRLTARLFYLLPLQDLMSFVFWAIAIFGNRIRWRGRPMLLLPDGRLGPAS